MSIFQRVDALEAAGDLHFWFLVGLGAAFAICGVCAAYNAGDIRRLQDEVDELRKLVPRVDVLEQVAVKFANNITAPAEPPKRGTDTNEMPVIAPRVQRPKPIPGPRTVPAGRVIEAGAHDLADTAPVQPVASGGRHRKERP